MKIFGSISSQVPYGGRSQVKANTNNVLVERSQDHFPVCVIFNMSQLVVFLFMCNIVSILASNETPNLCSSNIHFESALEVMELQAPKLDIKSYPIKNSWENTSNIFTIGIGYHHGNPNSPDTKSLAEIKRVHTLMNKASDMFSGPSVALTEGAPEGDPICKKRPDHFICHGLSQNIDVIGADNPKIFSTIYPTSHHVKEANKKDRREQTLESMCHFYTTYLKFFSSSDKEIKRRDKHVINQLSLIKSNLKEPTMVFIFRGSNHFKSHSLLTGVIDKLYITETALSEYKKDNQTKKELRATLKKYCHSFQV